MVIEYSTVPSSLIEVTVTDDSGVNRPCDDSSWVRVSSKISMTSAVWLASKLVVFMLSTANDPVVVTPTTSICSFR